jgi:hypothetical protein
MTSLASPTAIFLVAGTAHAQAFSREALVKAFRQGGYIIVMRHASSSREALDPQTANPDTVRSERQLDEAGRPSAIAMG